MRLINFQNDNLCINAGIISDDEVLAKCHRKLELLEYLLGNSEYDNVIARKKFTIVDKSRKKLLK